MMTLESRTTAMEQEREGVEAARQELTKARADMRTTREMAATFARELEHLPAIATTLSQDLVRLDGLVRSAHEDIAGAAKRVEDLETTVATLREEIARLAHDAETRRERPTSPAAARAPHDVMPALPARARENTNAVARVSQLMDEARAAIRSLALDPDVADRLDDQVGRMQTQLDTGNGARECPGCSGIRPGARRPDRKARGARKSGICKRRATPRGGMPRPGVMLRITRPGAGYQPPRGNRPASW